MAKSPSALFFTTLFALACAVLIGVAAAWGVFFLREPLPKPKSIPLPLVARGGSWHGEFAVAIVPISMEQMALKALDPKDLHVNLSSKRDVIEALYWIPEGKTIIFTAGQTFPVRWEGLGYYSTGKVVRSQDDNSRDVIVVYPRIATKTYIVFSCLLILIAVSGYGATWCGRWWYAGR